MPGPHRVRMLVVGGALSSLALTAFPAQAATSGARLSDPAGDMAVPSLDVVSGLIRLDVSGTTRTLTMTASMTGDLTGLPADYDLVTGVRRGTTCHTLATRVRWNGASLAQSYQHTSTFPCDGDATLATLASLAGETARYAAGGAPVDATAGGRTVTVTLAAPTWLRRGSLAGFSVYSHSTALGFSTNAGSTQVRNYDLAGLDRQWRVG